MATSNMMENDGEDESTRFRTWLNLFAKRIVIAIFGWEMYDNSFFFHTIYMNIKDENGSSFTSLAQIGF